MATCLNYPWRGSRNALRRASSPSRTQGLKCSQHSHYFASLLANHLCSGINRKFALEGVRQALRGRVVHISLSRWALLSIYFKAFNIMSLFLTILHHHQVFKNTLAHQRRRCCSFVTAWASCESFFSFLSSLKYVHGNSHMRITER